MDYNPNVILVFSNCITVIEAKLKVYRAYRAPKYPDNFFIHHKYDDNDYISKLSAFCKATFVCDKINSMANGIPEDYIFDIVSEEVGDISMTTIARICADVALEHGEQNIGTKGRETDIDVSLQMLLQETVKRTCKFLGCLSYRRIVSFAYRRQHIPETVPREIYEKIFYEALKVHVSEYESKYSFGRPSADENFYKFRRKVASNVLRIIKENIKTIVGTFKKRYKETIKDLQDVCVTLRSFKKRCRPSSMPECK